MAAITLASLRALGKRISDSVIEMLSVEDTGTEYILKTRAELTGSIPAGSNVIGALVDRHEELVKVSPIDFAGKVSGRTYDVPHVAKWKQNVTTFDSPATFAVEATTVYYGNFAAQDGASFGVASSINTGYSQALFSFDLLTAARRALGIPKGWTVADLIANVKALTITWVGYGVGSNAGVSTNGATVKLWSFGSNAWVNSGSNATSTSSSVQFDGSTGGIDPASGFLHILAHPN